MRIAILFLCAAFAGAEQMQVLMVDETGKINVPGVLATTAEMTTNANAIAIAEAKSEAAEKAAKNATNLVNQIVADIANNHLVIYRKGFMSSFASTVFLSADDRVLIVEFKPFAANSAEIEGVIHYGHKLRYAVTADVGTVKPTIKARSSLTTGDFTPVNESLVGAPILVPGTYTDAEGVVYNNLYEVTFYQPEADRGFYVIYITGDTPDGDGSTLNIHGGITGGYTGDAIIGDKILRFKGGFCMGEKE